LVAKLIAGSSLYKFDSAGVLRYRMGYFGFGAKSIPGFLDSWIPGFLDSWIPGFLDCWHGADLIRSLLTYKAG